MLFYLRSVLSLTTLIRAENKQEEIFFAVSANPLWVSLQTKPFFPSSSGLCYFLVVCAHKIIISAYPATYQVRTSVLGCDKCTSVWGHLLTWASCSTRSLIASHGCQQMKSPVIKATNFKKV